MEERLETNDITLMQRLSDSIYEQIVITDVTKNSSLDRKLQRTVEQTLDDQMNKSISRTMEESFEIDKSVLPQQISEMICEHSGIMNLIKISSQVRSLQRAKEQILNNCVDQVQQQAAEHICAWWRKREADYLRRKLSVQREGDLKLQCLFHKSVGNLKKIVEFNAQVSWWLGKTSEIIEFRKIFSTHINRDERLDVLKELETQLRVQFGLTFEGGKEEL